GGGRVARATPRRRRVVRGLADGGGAHPGHRPVSPARAGEDAPRGGSRDRGRRGLDGGRSAARDRARGAPEARPSRAARAAAGPAPPAHPLRSAGSALRRDRHLPPASPRDREEPHQPRPPRARQAPARQARSTRLPNVRVRMDCRRVEELLSDHHEGVLAPDVRAEVDTHLEECPDCKALLEALSNVVDALRSFPVLEPSSDLADRVAKAALTRPRLTARPRPRHVPSWLQAAAAGFALVAAGAFLLVTGPEAPTRAATRLVDRTVTAGSFLLERKDRLVEDVRILGVVIGTAFEGRL